MTIMRALIVFVLTFSVFSIFGQSGQVFTYSYTPDVPYLALCPGQTLHRLEQEHPGLTAAFAAAHPDVPLHQVQADVPYELPAGWQTIDCPGLILAPNAIVRIRTLETWNWDEGVVAEMARVSGRKITEPAGQMTYFAATPSGGSQPVRVGNATSLGGGIDRYASWEADHQVTVPHGAGIRAIARNYCGCVDEWVDYCVAEIEFRTGRTAAQGLVAGTEISIPSMYPYYAPTGAVYIEALRGMTFWSLSRWVYETHGREAAWSFLYSASTFINGRTEDEVRDIPTGTIFKFYTNFQSMSLADSRAYQVLMGGWRPLHPWMLSFVTEVMKE